MKRTNPSGRTRLLGDRGKPAAGQPAPAVEPRQRPTPKAAKPAVPKGHFNIRHGHACPGRETGEYRSWVRMWSRCRDPNLPSFENYGGRGIAVCERWQSFENFLADMGPRPSPEHSLDRYPDNDGNYEPGNCRWATRIQQANNKRNNRILEYDGRSQTLAQWARERGLSRKVLMDRLDDGWTMERALTEPVADPGRFAGEKNGRAILTWDRVRQIRREYASGGLTTLQIAARYGIGKSQAHNVVSGKSWHETSQD